MRLRSPTVAGLQTTSVTPSRPIAPGTGSQNAGRKVTCDRRAAAKAGERERDRGHCEGAEEAADVRTHELLADELTDPGDEEDDQEPARSATRAEKYTAVSTPNTTTPSHGAHQPRRLT
jgi:hypothetical protein